MKNTRITTLAAFCILLSPTLVLSQNLPWKNSSNSQMQSPQAQSAHHYNNQNNNSAPVHALSTRDADDRRLALLTSKFYAVHENSPHAIQTIKSIEQQVHDLQSQLQNVSDENDILNDTNYLKERITRQRKEWEQRRATAAKNVTPTPVSANSPAPAK